MRPGGRRSVHIRHPPVEDPRYVRIERDAFSRLPYTGTLFPAVKGLTGGSELINMFQLSYDTRGARIVVVMR